MNRNIEIKARVDDRDAVGARAMATAAPFELVQHDTFFRCDTGRLKLRVFGDGTGELTFYQRADTRGPKSSFYLRSPIATPATLRESLAMAYGEAGHVSKHRRVVLVGRTRVHLDRVDALGDFIELEVVLDEDEDARDGRREAEALLAALGIADDQRLAGAYVDLLAD